MSSSFLPEFETLLQDQVPLPAYSLKLMRACTDKSREMKQQLVRDTAVFRQLLDLFAAHRSQFRHGSVLQHVVGILNDLIADKTADVMFVCRHGFVDEFASLFVDVAATLEDDSTDNGYDMSHLMLQLLDIMHHVLKKIEQSIKRVLSSASSQRVQSGGSTVSSSSAPDVTKEDVEELLQRTNVLCELSGLLMGMLSCDDGDIQEWATRSLYLSAELFGGSTPDECFTDGNLNALREAIRTSARKRQKLLLRILKRFMNTNEHCRTQVTGSVSFKELFDWLFTSLKGDDNDTKSVRNVASELNKLCS